VTGGEEESGPEEEGGSPAWMATFADLMSLLLTFFILILSFANMDVIKFSAAVDSLHDAFGSAVAIEELQGNLVAAPIELSALARTRIIELKAGGSQEMEDLRRKIETMIQRSNLQNLVEVDESDRGVVVRVIGQLLFDPGSIELRPESFVVLNEIGRLIAAVSDDVSIEGHTDDTPATHEVSNWHLSAGRAISVLEYLAETQQIDPKRLSVAGYSSTRPLVANDSDENREMNRRVEFVFLRPVATSASQS